MLAKRSWLLLFVAFAAFYLYGLGHLPLVGPDEPRYAQVAREMFQRHDLITPTLGGRAWFEKPALLYWAMSASYKIFGVSEWAARLSSGLAGLLSVVAIWWVASRIERGIGMRGFALAATVVMGTSAGVIVFSRAASFDILITMTLTWTLSFFLGYEISDKRKGWFLVGFYIFVGFSLLAKGLIGIVLPVGIVSVYYLLRLRRPSRSFLFSLLWGIPITVATAAVWYAPVIARHGRVFIDQFFIQHHFERYLSNKYQHAQPIYFFIPIVLMLALPWTFYLIEALIKVKDWKRIDEPASTVRFFCLAWFLVPIVFFSFSGSKLPGYILPSLPAAALLVGERLVMFMRGNGGLATMRATTVVCLLIAIAGGTYLAVQGTVGRAGLFCVVMLAALCLAALLVCRHRRIAATLVAVMPLVLSVLALNDGATTVAARYSMRNLIVRADAAGYGSSPVLMFERIERTSEFYASGRVVYAADGDPIKMESAGEIAVLLREINGPALMIVPLGSLPRLQQETAVETKVIGDNGRNALVAVQAR